jgi:SWI/SNF-related matrix-associated actin-dependent regulator 1 of chromatin subfamily A
MASPSPGRWVNSPRPTCAAPFCSEHQVPCALRQTKKEGANTGRWFFTCPSTGCKTMAFLWADQTPLRTPGSGTPRGQGTSPAQPSASPTPKRLSFGGVGVKVHVTLQDDSSCFGLDCPTVDQAVVDFCRGLQPLGARWNPTAKVWTVPMTHQESVLQRLRTSVPDVRIIQVPQFVKDLLASPHAQHLSVPGLDLPSANGEKYSLASDLKPHQRVGVLAVLRRRGRAMLCDEPGLGKTAQAIAVAVCYPDDWPLLVMCPPSMCATWATELANWLPPGFASVHVMQTSKKPPPMPAPGMRQCVVASYSMVPQLPPTCKYSIVVADESHLLKNGDTQRAKSCVPFLRRAKRALLLSGSPCLQRPAELYTQVYATMPDSMPSFTEFANRYCDPKPSNIPGMVVDYSGSSCLGELNMWLHRTCFIRRTKDLVGQKLPAKSRRIVRLILPPAALAKLAKVQAEFNATDDVAARRALSADYYSKTAEAKAEAVCSHVASALQSAPGDKHLVFAHHSVILDSLEEMLKLKGVPYVRLDGTTTASQRTQRIDAFQSNLGIRVALLSITALGVGVTLTAASSVIMAELVWSPGVLRQAEDRAHRIGQQRDVAVTYLLATGSLDDVMWRVLERKLDVVAAAVDGGTSKELAEAWVDEFLAEAKALAKGKRRLSNREIDEDDVPVAEQKRRSASAACGDGTTPDTCIVID